MSFARPTLTDLRQQSRDDFTAEIPGADGRLNQTNLRVIGDVLAAMVHGLYGYLDFIVQQTIPDTAEAQYLERWSAFWGITRKAATKATGNITFTGQDGSSIPTDALVATAAGDQFKVTAGVTLSSGSAVASVTAVVAGAAGNLDASTSVSLVTALAGVDGTALVTSDAIVGGADEEADASLRARMLTRIKEPPHGGAKADYVTWAREVAGVTRAWAYPGEQGIGTVTVRFMMDTVQSANAGIPQGDAAPDYTGDLKTVFDHIDPLRPVTADVYVAAPTAVDLDITIQDLTTDTPETRAAIEAEIASMLLRQAEPGSTIRLSNIYEAISLATGERYHTITSPAGDKAHAIGEIAVPGAITYTTS